MQGHAAVRLNGDGPGRGVCWRAATSSILRLVEGAKTGKRQPRRIGSSMVETKQSACMQVRVLPDPLVVVNVFQQKPFSQVKTQVP